MRRGPKIKKFGENGCNYNRQMSMESSTYIGFMDGAIHHTQHSSSAAWVIYTPMGQILSSGGVCLRPASNNVAEYTVVIELL